MDDNKIIRLYMERSEQAISETSVKYGRYCHFIAFNILQNDNDAEECVNDTYLRTWNSIPPKQPNRLQTFLGKITRNLALNRYEKQSAKKRGSGLIPVILDELGECISSEARTENIVDELAVKDILDSFLRKLPAETRKIFVRRYWYMDSVKDIAAAYKLSESNVTVTLFRTRKKLKELFEKEGITI
ncbi:MAG: RNA polymerase sigma factor [Lachnospiraceae bacterium]|nr:RNA polymerase sigma factor [Lachnospiraceae bacterium]